jgi:hypothetical protein
MKPSEVGNPVVSSANRQPAWVWVLLAVLSAIRLPSLAQPMGLDQGVYSYVGQRVVAGDLPYRDVWDHKPPGLHVAYAAMWRLWPDEAVVPLADLLLAMAVALLLLRLAPHFARSRLAGPLAAALFLLLGNPVFARFGGVRVRAQAETFIAALVTASIYVALRAAGEPGRAISAKRHAMLILAGALVGVAALMKYQAAIFVVVPWAAVAWAGPTGGPARSRVRASLESGASLLIGLLMPLVAVIATYAANGALVSLWNATVRFNLNYAGETFADRWAMLRFLFWFPMRQARVDGLWLVGGVGALALAWQSIRHPRRLLVIGWIAVACLSIAMNGSRGLPQYFIQASPALALAAGISAAEAVDRRGLWFALGLLLVGTWAVARVVSVPGAVEATSWDTSRLLGRTDKAVYVAKFAGRPGDKYSPPDAYDLAARLRAKTSPGDTVYVFGFSAAAYVYSERRSASRLFFIAPVVADVARDWPGYGPHALLADLVANRPAVIALQRDDAGSGPLDSRGWFLAHSDLADWLRQNYAATDPLNRFELWERRD